MRTIVDRSIAVPAYRVGGPGDPYRLDIGYRITDEEWTSAGGCPCGRFHGQRDGAMVHCAYDDT